MEKKRAMQSKPGPSLEGYSSNSNSIVFEERGNSIQQVESQNIGRQTHNSHNTTNLNITLQGINSQNMLKNLLQAHEPAKNIQPNLESLLLQFAQSYIQNAQINNRNNRDDLDVTDNNEEPLELEEKKGENDDIEAAVTENLHEQSLASEKNHDEILFQNQIKLEMTSFFEKLQEKNSENDKEKSELEIKNIATTMANEINEKYLVKLTSSKPYYNNYLIQILQSEQLYETMIQNRTKGEQNMFSNQMIEKQKGKKANPRKYDSMPLYNRKLAPFGYHGAVVDPDANIIGSVVFDFELGKFYTNKIEQQRKFYYQIQLIQPQVQKDQEVVFQVYCRWGRLSSDKAKQESQIHEFQEDEFYSAQQLYLEKFRQKSGFEWSECKDVNIISRDLRKQQLRQAKLYSYFS